MRDVIIRSLLIVATFVLQQSMAQGGGVLSGGELPDLVTCNESGERLSLRKVCDDRYTLLVMGCLTCPEFRRAHPSIECINADYAPKGVQTFFVYKTLRHPELSGYVDAQNISERVMMVSEIKSLLGGDIPWLIDDMNNNISLTLRSGSRSGYLISPDGKIIEAWDKPEEQAIRQSLSRLVGEPNNVTKVEDLKLPAVDRVQRRDNIDGVNSIERGDGLTILKTTPTNAEETYYVKMRAEADASLLESGNGRIALGFFPDPIHDAHWNNLTPPMKYLLDLPDGVTATPKEASALRGEGDSDSKPRQFWVDIQGASPSSVITITYHYYGCTPDLCEALTHTYTIELSPEEKGARTFGFNRGPKSNNNRQQREQGGQRGQSRGQYRF